MNKELEYVEELKLKYQENGAIRRLNAIEKSLKALEIIKEKNVLILTLKNIESVDIYNDCIGVSKKLTQEQFNLLKEVLK